MHLTQRAGVRDYASLAQQLEADALAAVPALSPALIHSLCLRLPLDDLPQILLIVHFHSQVLPFSHLLCVCFFFFENVCD